MKKVYLGIIMVIYDLLSNELETVLKINSPIDFNRTRLFLTV